MNMQVALAFVDDDGNEILLDAEEAFTLFALTNDLDSATVSACPTCHSRVLAAVALRDLLVDAPPHPRAGDLEVLADEAPTLHVYAVDLVTGCDHQGWRDPGSEEWFEVVGDYQPASHTED